MKDDHLTSALFSVRLSMHFWFVFVQILKYPEHLFHRKEKYLTGEKNMKKTKINIRKGKLYFVNDTHYTNTGISPSSGFQPFMEFVVIIPARKPGIVC